MGVPVLEGWQASSTGGANPLFLDMAAPAGIVAGEKLGIIVFNDSVAGNLSFSTTEPGFNKIGEAGTTQTDAHVALFVKDSASGSEGTVTIDQSNTYEMAGWYFRISGSDPGEGVHVSNFSPFSPRSSHAIPSVTTTVADCLVFYGLGFDGGDGVPFSISGTGWGEIDEEQSGASNSDAGGVFGSRDLATAGASGAATVGSNVADGSAVFQAAFAPAPVAGAVSRRDPYNRYLRHNLMR